MGVRRVKAVAEVVVAKVKGKARVAVGVKVVVTISGETEGRPWSQVDRRA